MIKIKYLREKIFIGIVIIIGVLARRLFNTYCVFLRIAGYECFGCGMTRALLSALKLDFASAFHYHRMFWSLPILGLYVLFDGNLFKNRIINIGVLIVILIGFVVNWVLNLVA